MDSSMMWTKRPETIQRHAWILANSTKMPAPELRGGLHTVELPLAVGFTGNVTFMSEGLKVSS